MYVKRVFYDDFKDLSNVEKSIDFPTWEDIEIIPNPWTWYTQEEIM